MFRGLLRPGQGFKEFNVLEKKGGLTETGRPITKHYEETRRIIGIISQADQKEIEQWKQSGHPITHTIVQRGSVNRAKAYDMLELLSGPDCPRYFYIQGVQDPGELGHFTIYKVEEREDLQ